MGRILSIDSSVTCPGFAVMERGELLQVSSLKTKILGPGRWFLIIDHLRSLIDRHTFQFCVIENYAYSSFELSTLAELNGVIKWHLMLEEIPYGSVAPNTLKKFFTGDGRAKKEQMMRECERRGYEPKNDNEADAIALAHFADQLGFEALKNCWPHPLPKK